MTQTDLVVDLNGYFTPTMSYDPAAPSRLLETRSGEGLNTVDGLFNAIGVRIGGSVTELQVTGRAGVPADAIAVALNVAVDNPAGAGFITVFPCGSPIPNIATVNYAAGITASNGTIAQIGAGGKVCIYTMTQTDLIVDLNGWFPHS